MPATASRTRKRTIYLDCTVCPTQHADETDLVIHLVEDHGAIWTTTNSFGLDDLVIPSPRESYDEEPVEEPGWISRLLHRTA